MAEAIYGDPFETNQRKIRARVRMGIIFAAVFAFSISLNVGLAIKLIQERHGRRIDSGEIQMTRDYRSRSRPQIVYVRGEIE